MALGDIRPEFGRILPRSGRPKELGPLFKTRISGDGITIVVNDKNIQPNEWFAFYNDRIIPANELNRDEVEILRRKGQMIAYNTKEGVLSGTSYDIDKLANGDPIVRQLTYRRYGNSVNNILYQHPLPSSGVEGHEVDPNPPLEIEKSLGTAFDINISDFEQLFQILVNIKEIQELAAKEGADPRDIGWLSYALERCETLTFPHFISRLPTLDLLSQILNYRAEGYIHNLIAVWNNAGGDLDAISLDKEFSELADMQRRHLLHFLRKINSLAKGWMGIQRHYFEEMFRDWLYFALHGPTPTLEYFSKKYSCKSDYEIKCIYDCISASIVPDGKESDTIYSFINNFKYFIRSFVPEGNAYLLQGHIASIWGGKVLDSAIDDLCNSWIQEFGDLGIDLTNIFEIETPSLSELIRDGKLPAEMQSAQTVDELRVINRIFFPDGKCIQVRAMLDRVDLSNGTIDDWKTRCRHDLNDWERLQILLQQLCLKKLLNKDNADPVDRNGYRYCGVKTFVNPESIGRVLSGLPAFNDRPLEYSEDEFSHGIVTHQQDVSDSFYLISALERILRFLISHRDIMHDAINYSKSVGSIPTPRLVNPSETAELKKKVEVFTGETYGYLEA